MRALAVRVALGVALAGGLSVPLGRAEEGAKALPTLLIKGEVVSLDTNDPAASLLKVKDRYGFETPIFVTAETKVAQGEATPDISSLTTGASVEVEYNFDVNTAKRHAVSVKVITPAAEAAAVVEPAPAAEAVPAAPAPEAAAAAEAPAGESAPAAAPASSDAPAEAAPPLAEDAAPAP